MNSDAAFAQITFTRDTAEISRILKTIIDSQAMEPRQAMDIGKEVLRIATKDNYKEGIARGLNTIAEVNGIIGNTKVAVEGYLKAIDICNENKLYKIKAESLNGIGVMYGILGLTEKSFDCYTEALAIFEKENDSANIALCFKYLGYCMMGSRRYNEAKTYFMRSLEINKKQGNWLVLESNYSDLAGACNEQKKYKDAFQNVWEGMRIANKIKDTLNELLNNVGACYQLTENYDSAIVYYNKSLQKDIQANDVEGECTVLINLGSLNFKVHRLPEAEKYSKQALELAQKMGHNLGILASSTDLADLYAFKKDYKKSFEYKTLAYAANDSLMNKEKQKAIAEMQVRFDVKELDNKNKILQKENDLKQVKLQRNKILMLCVFGAAILSLIIGFLAIRQSRLKTNQQKLELEQKQLLAQINPHFIFNCLNSIQQFVVQNDTLNANKYLADFALLMRQTLDNSKDGTITLLREIEYLENYISFEHMRFEDKFSYTIGCFANMNTETVEIPSMIIQPFVENAIRHGLCNLEDRKGLLKIVFYKKDNFLYCEVDDNGIGMEEARALKSKSFIKYQSHGMDLTRKRLALVSKMNSKDYEISIVNKKGPDQNAQGTTIIIKFPLQA